MKYDTATFRLRSWLNANDPSAPGYRNAVLTHRLLTDIRENDTADRRAYVAERLDHF